VKGEVGCMGYLLVVALGPLRQALPPDALAWPGKFSAHDLWHLFVLGGSACHFVLILRFVA